MGNATHLTTVIPPWRLRPLAAAIVAIGALVPEPGRAATLTVATLAQSSGVACTLRDALHSVDAQADQGQCVASGAYGVNDRVDFTPALTGSITFFSTDPLSANPLDPSALVIQRPIIVQGAGSALLTLTCGNVAARLLEVDAGAGSVSLDGVTIANCQASGFGQGGGVLVAAKLGKTRTTLALSDVTLTGNRAVVGGGLALSGPNVGTTVTLTACNVFANNAIVNGGGLAVDSNILHVVDSVVAGNSAQLGGGASAVGALADITFTRATISSNVANIRGGGIYVQQAAGTVLDSTIANNQAVEGGGVFVDRGRFGATNSTLSGNQASDKGSALFINSGGPGALLLANSTIAANISRLAGAVAVENTLPLGMMTPAVAIIIDTIVAGNEATPDIEANDPLVPGGVPWDVSYSVIGQPGTVTLVGTGNKTGPAVPPPFGASGWLGPLQDNGGPTQTHALLTGPDPVVPNPALDAGDPAFSGLQYDQRGAPFLRVQNGRVDIGAYELQVQQQSVPGLRGRALFALSALLGWLGWRRLRQRRLAR
ncbi:MAG TPA: choice-of-anchor Q domain-containing protein [Casimicrobiaceae bacterium]|nr:choice-of-anchor Q domain-containing protein [Casimicrobiaceae bacterium]